MVTPNLKPHAHVVNIKILGNSQGLFFGYFAKFCLKLLSGCLYCNSYFCFNKHHCTTNPRWTMLLGGVT